MSVAGFMSEQNLNSTRCMSLSFGGLCLGSKYLPLPSMGIFNTPSGRKKSSSAAKVIISSISQDAKSHQQQQIHFEKARQVFANFHSY
jgi:hypothetical protein